MSLRWEGHDLQPAHRRWRFWVAEGRDELPEVRSASQVIPFRRGRLHVPAFADKRTLEVRGYVQEVDEPALRAELDLLKGLLDPTGDSPGTLVDDFEDGSERWLHAIPRNVIPRYGGEATRLLSIELEALDPYWYGAYGIGTLDSGLFLDDGWFLDGGADIIVVGSGDHALTNPGTAASEKVRVVVTGPSSGPVTVEITGSVPIGFTYPALLTGQTLIVDNHERTVTLETTSAPTVSGRQGITFRPGNEHGEYLRLPPGAQTLRVSGNPTETRIHFTPTYL